MIKEIKLGNPEEIARLNSFFSTAYTADILKSYLVSVWSFIPEHPVVTRNGKSVNTAKYFPDGKKATYLKKAECVEIISVLHSHPDNMRCLISLMPAYVGTALRMAISYGRVGQTLLESAGASSAVEIDRDCWWDRHMKNARYMELFDVSESMAHGDDRYGTEWYLSIPPAIRFNYAVPLMPEVTLDSMYFPDGGNGCRTACAEKEFVSSFPVIEGLFRQGELKTAGLKMSSSAAMKMLKATTVPELVPASVMKRQKISVGQYFFPAVCMALLRLKSGGACECVREAFTIMRTSYAAMLVPAMLPHIKGFRATGMPKLRPAWWAELITQCFENMPDAWLSLEDLRAYVYACPTNAFFGTPMFERWKMELHNTLGTEKIYPDTQWKDIDLAVIRGIAAAMFGMGLVEVAWHDAEEEISDPLAHVKRIRLTALGKYALGLSDTYKAEAIETRDWFRLDEDHLIVSSMCENNPYEALLADIAVPIGAGRYRIDSGSFLKKCTTVAEVNEKISFFKDYICAEPSGIWKEFFVSLKKRCNPFSGENKKYLMMKMTESSPELIRILSSDSEIRSLIVLVEGGRFMIQEKDFRRFSELMKVRGYLV